ncbi:MAG: Hpt domain-containing protein, partial [Burkholderiales bacterium]|nr:Hpt domain-containing protein [Phycisphaerae bacterium]
LAKPIRTEQLVAMLGRYLRVIELAPQAEETEAIAGESAGQDDANKLRSSLATNEKLKGVLERFVTRLPERIDEMQRLVREQDLDNLARAVHQMKGAAGGYGFPDITQAATRAEDCIKRADDVGSIATQIDQLVGLIRRVDGFPDVGILPKTSEIVRAVKPAPIAVPVARSQSKVHVDPRTGLANRSNLLERLSAEIALARRQGTPLGCIVIHIDQFAEIESRFSSEAADSVIKRIAAGMDALHRDEIDIFRPDTSHLIILAPGKNADGAHALASEVGQWIGAQRFADLIGDWSLLCIFGIVELKLTTPCAADLLALAIKEIADTHTRANDKAQSARRLIS